MLDGSPVASSDPFGALAGGSAAHWDPETEGELVCRAVRDETHDVRTFILAAPSSRPFHYEPGQFLTFEFDINGTAVSRCYTMSSTPTRPHLVSITVKRVPGGEVSDWLHATVRPGTRLRTAGFTGGFTSTAHPAPRALYLSGGSGITPLMSMARAHDDLASDADIVFLHAARTPADIIFRAELELMARHRESFRFVPICERDAPREPWHGLRGRISAAQAGFTVEFAKSGVSVQCEAGTSVLAAARAAGLRLPYACTKGVCGTCKSRVVSGRVDMQHGGGIRQREIDAGMALLCCSRPLTDLVIDR